MDANHAWRIGVEHALRQFQDEFATRLIEDLLDQANGKITEVLRLARREPEKMGRSPGFYLGNFGVCCSEYTVQCYGNAPLNPVEVWLGPNHAGRPPDLIIPWREILEHVKGAARQPALPGL